MNRTNLKEDDVGVGLGESEEREREDGGGAAVEDRRAHRHQGLRGALRLGALFKNSVHYLQFPVAYASSSPRNARFTQPFPFPLSAEMSFMYPHKVIYR